MEQLPVTSLPHYRAIVALDIERSTSRPDPIKSRPSPVSWPTTTPASRPPAGCNGSCGSASSPTQETSVTTPTGVSARH